MKGTTIRIKIDGETIARLLLTRDQIKLLDWLSDNYCFSDSVAYELEDNMSITILDE